MGACDRGPDRGVEVPLFDADHVPDVLVESHQLEPPPSLGGNSFVRGWSPWRERLARAREVKHEAGLTRLRFQARGNGPAASWKALRLRAPAASTHELASEATPSAPRLVLVYVMDALRADQVGHLGGPAGVSPTLDRLASEGVVLEGHQALASNTLPSVRNLFTGRVYLDDGMASLPPATEGPPTLAEVFGRAGYTSGLFTGNGYVYYQAKRAPRALDLLVAGPAGAAPGSTRRATISTCTPPCGG